MPSLDRQLYTPPTVIQRLETFVFKLFAPAGRFFSFLKLQKGFQALFWMSVILLPGLGSLRMRQYLTGIVHIFISFIFYYYLFTTGWMHAFGLITNPVIQLPLFFFTILMLYVFYVLYCLNNILDIYDKKIQYYALEKSIVNLLLGLKQWIYDFKQLEKTNFKTTLYLGVFIMGYPQLRLKQWIKGSFLLLLQVTFITYIILIGHTHIVGFFTLNVPFQVSTASLVYGILSLLLTLYFLWMVQQHLIDMVHGLTKAHHKLTFRQGQGELDELLNRKFYVLSLSLPVLGAITFTIIPLLFMILIAFTDFSTSGTIPILNVRWIQWTGFDSFIRLFTLQTNLQAFTTVVSWTFVWAFFATFTTYFGGMFLAMFIKKKTFKHQALFRSLFVLTLAVPQFITLRVMYVMFNDFGPINQWLLSQTIITDRILFWSDINLAKTLIILVNMWVGIPYYMLLMSGLLLNIPKDHYEAAAIEGASRWQQFRYITFPHLLFMTSPLLITGFVGNINNFNVIWLLTGGRPLGLGTGGVAGGTDILITWLYKLTMQNNPEYNLGAAIGIIMFIFSSVISLFIFRKSSAYAREEEFQG